MDHQRKLNLDDLAPMWDRKFSYPMSEPDLNRLLRRDEHVLEPARLEDVVWEVGTLAQDVFSATVIRQGRIQR